MTNSKLIKLPKQEGSRVAGSSKNFLLKIISNKKSIFLLLLYCTTHSTYVCTFLFGKFMYVCILVTRDMLTNEFYINVFEGVVAAE